MPCTECRFFRGDRPCNKNPICDEQCPQKSSVSVNILLVHLGALGAVLRSTALLHAIHRKYPSCRLIWLTDAPAHQLLQGNPLIDLVYTSADLAELQSWSFDIALVVDKSRRASGLIRNLDIEQIYGFITNPQTGAVLPATSKANELWQLGLDNEAKFFKNQKTELQLVAEALELPDWKRDEYQLPLDKAELELSQRRRNAWLADPSEPLIGINTGCSSVIPYKKWSVAYHRRLIEALLAHGYRNLVLLGGKEDQERNVQIGEGLSVIQSATDAGLREGILSVEACDILISGDSLGMHMGIARRKFVIAWFGPTCAQEIELYDRGVKLQSKSPCAPCWKRFCDRPQMCYDQVELQDVLNAVHQGVQWSKNKPSLSCKPHSLGMSF